jgi:hypothetical protein
MYTLHLHNSSGHLIFEEQYDCAASACNDADAIDWAERSTPEGVRYWEAPRVASAEYYTLWEN